MKNLFTLLFVTVLFFGFYNNNNAQACDILYFCVKYDGGEIDCSDRFTTGKITVMVRLASPIYFTNVTIQLDKYNPREGIFEYYDDYPFDVEADMTYIFFRDINFKDPGFYRVFLLDPSKNTITSAVVEIIRE
jgi:hypothetical protein